jgi:thioredoxin-dependent peroxiredoxin
MSKTKKIVLACLIVLTGLGMLLSYRHMQQLCDVGSKRYLEQTAATDIPFLKEGNKAPDFELQAFPSQKVRLSDFQHKKNVVIAFYPKDSSSGCTREMCALTNDLEQFKKADTEVLGISCDPIDDHKKFISDNDLQIILLSDLDGKTAQAYGVKAKQKTKARRVLFVIDKQGIIRYVVVGMPDNNQLLRIVHTLN